MTDPWAPTGIDTTRPSIARIYDYALGGKDNFAVDREAAEKLFAVGGPSGAKENRAFLIRAVRFLAAEAGVRQFLDIGTGLPTQNNVHQVAHGIAPEAHVVYVDYDPVVLAHARALLSGVDNATVVQGDARRPEEILAHPEVRAEIDLELPVAVLMAGLLHVISDEDDPTGIIATFRRAMAPGSYLALSHITSEGHSADEVSRFVQAFEHSPQPMVPRSHEQIQRFFGDLELLDPGLVQAAAWRPDTTKDAPRSGWLLAGVARKSQFVAVEPGR